jgi:hypothetical protein
VSAFSRSVTSHTAIILLTAIYSQLGVWPRHVVIRQLVGSVATAVQRGNAVAWLSGYSRALAATARERRVKEKRQDEAAQVGESDTE